MMLQQGQINPITDEKSFNAFYKEYKGFVYKVALQFTGCSETAKDVRQYVFMRIWINRTKIDPVQNVKSYVFICTRNEALMFWKNNERMMSGLKQIILLNPFRHKEI